MKNISFTAILALVLILPFSAIAVQPDEVLQDPVLEERARALSKELRCVVCQSESIDESNVDLARDMRIRIRQLLTEGKSDTEVVNFMVDRYGDYVLMRPPFKWTTWVLWLGPVAFVMVGLFILALTIGASRKNRSTEDSGAAPMTDEEKRRLKQLLDEESGDIRS